MQKKILISIIIIVVVAIIALGGLFAYQYFNKYPFTTGPLVKPNPNIQNLNSETAGWKTYKNDTLNYEFKYPEDFIVQDVGKYQADDYVFRACDSQKNICIYSNIIRYKQPSFNDYVKLFTNPTIPANNPNLKTLNSYVMEVASKKGFVLETSVSSPDREDKVIDVFIDYNWPVLVQVNISGSNLEIDKLEDIYNRLITTFKFTK